MSLAFSLLVLLLLQPIRTLAHSLNSSDFRLDVHSHIIPDFWRDAVIKAGYPVRNGTLYTDGYAVPDWNITTHIAAMDTDNVSYALMSITAPGLSFLAHDANASKALARRTNLQMREWMDEYPSRLGALCCLPMPHVEESVEEIDFCMTNLSFTGIGLFSNFNGTYLGSPQLDPVMSAIRTHNATSFVHPALPGCTNASIGLPSPLTEYPFDSVRAIENLLFSGTRAKYSDLNIIFPHAGGALPYLAARIALSATLPAFGSYNSTVVMEQLGSYYFDTASATSAIQLTALKMFGGGIDRIVIGTDFPYIAGPSGEAGLKSIQANGNFTDMEMAQINAGNALAIFPQVSEVLGLV